MRFLFVPLALATLTFAASCGGGGSNGPTSSSSSSVTGQLSFEQVEKLNSIIRADPAVMEIATQSTFTVTDINSWSVGTVPDTGETSYAGGIATMVLDHPVGHLELNLRLPSIRTYYASWSAEDRAKYPAYRVTPAKFAVDNFSRLQVSVDLDRGIVAGTRVLPLQQFGQRVAAIPVQPTPQVTAGIPQAATDIINADPRVAPLIAAPHQLTEGSTYTIANAHFSANAVHFDNLQTLEADWQILFEADQVTGVYESHTLHFKAAQVESLSIVVDLDKGVIAWLEPIRAKDATPRINTPTPIGSSTVPIPAP